MDSIDKQILAALMADGRMTWAELAARTGLSAAAAAQRVRRLERAGLIAGYAARLEPEALGAGLLAFVFVRFNDPRLRRGFLRKVRALPWIQECHHVAGDLDYLLKIRCSGTKELERIVSVELKDRCRAAETRTTIVLGSEKETTALPLPPD